MMFILKKLVSRFFFPLSLVIELLLLGIFLKKRRTKVILYDEGNEDVYTLRHATDCGPYRFSGCMGAFSDYRFFPAGRDLGQYGKGLL
jgi:hypothetical protein